MRHLSTLLACPKWEILLYVPSAPDFGRVKTCSPKIKKCREPVAFVSNSFSRYAASFDSSRLKFSVGNALFSIIQIIN